MLKHFYFLALVLSFPINATALSFNSQIPKKDSLQVMYLLDTAYSVKEIDYKKAVSLSLKALDRAQGLNSPYLKQATLYTAAMLNWYNGEHKLGLKRCQESIKYSAQLKDTFGLANNSAMMGLINLYTSDYDSSLYYFNNALTYYTAIKDTTQILKSRGFMGLVYDQQADFVKAKENLLATVVLKRQHNTYNWSVLRLSDQVGVSSKYYEESLKNAKENVEKLLKESPVSMNLRNAYHNEGMAYLKLGFADSALVAFKYSANTSIALGADVFWVDYAEAYAKLGLLDSAIWCNINAISEATINGTQIGLANAYEVLADAYTAKADYKNALSSYQKALFMQSKMNHKNSRANILRYIAGVFLKEHHYQKALVYTDSSEALARKIGARHAIARALKTKFLILSDKGDYKQALEVKLLYDILIDSLQKGKVQLDLAKLDLYNEVELNKLEISDLNKQKKLAEAKAKNKNLVIILIVIVAIFIVLLLVLNFYRTQKLLSLNKKLNAQQQLIGTQNQELSKSNKEKELLLGEIHHRVKNNLQTITSLLSIQQRKLKDSDSIKVLEDSKNRVMAMGLIHQHLYQNTSFAEINFKNYTKELIQVLISTNAYCAIDVKCRIPLLKIDLDNAIFFGLIINELAINSIKHAYKGVLKPLLEVSIFEENNKTALLVKDNGNKEHIDFDKSNSFGWKMVNNICDKLEGQLFADITSGLSVKILFNKSIIAIKSTTD